ncbi:MAG: hypothetical protein E7289_05170 [Lachnospiraceae bacterium]|nr:hypothetical protein [Lachnospiraceae bacterium]
MEQDKLDDVQLKNWLFKENMRLEDLREELSRASKMLREQADIVKQDELRLENEKKRFQSEKEEFKTQMHDWTSKIKEERKKLEEEQSFFDKKFKVLEMGFKQLDADRRTFEAKKRAFEYRKYEQENADSFQPLEDFTASEETFFFRGVTHPLALKKRYKDLIKIYHPDNLGGDKTMLQKINKEYDLLKKSITYQKKA